MWWWMSCAAPETEPGPTGPTGPVALDCAPVEPLAGAQPAECWAEPAPRCGGDPTGTWAATTSCDGEATTPLTTTLVDTRFDYACPGDTFVSREAFDEQIALVEDGTFTWTTASSSSEIWTVPASCYPTLGAEDCSGLSELYGYPCEEASDTCVCTVSDRDARVFFGGRWEVCEASLVFVTLDGTVTSTVSGVEATLPIGENQSQVWDFCADGDTLRLFSWQGSAAVGYTRAE